MTDLPETFNGEPTKYRLFDGFRRASTMMKVLYVAAPLMLGFGVVIPAAMEVIAYDASKNAAKNASYMQTASAAGAFPLPAASASAYGLDSSLSPMLSQPVDTRFQEDIARRRLEESARTPHI